jgi:starvation-inducible DNA-binding protein
MSKKETAVFPFEKIIPSLSKFTADTYVLYTKTQNAHWNVIDRRFFQLHKFFEEIYEELAEGIDELAERIRMVGGNAPGSLKEFLKLTRIDEVSGLVDGQTAIAELYVDHLEMTKRALELIKEAQKIGDEGTADLIISRLRFHEKSAWMLLSHLEE